MLKDVIQEVKRIIAELATNKSFTTQDDTSKEQASNNNASNAFGGHYSQVKQN